MSTISLAETPSAVEVRSIDHSFKAIVIFCCAGLVASFGLMAHGIDLSAGLM
ncbi:hypothetical protein G8O24_23790 [Bradyrhizobium sp. INPA01-394B]|uniref:MFS transporter n=1 Tax=Bradyrhizobium campsiandrae TaxID=1729892 RepID=A0ABR7UBS3_9BRAD|nr:hypothetical protein [Bradyrhizobium campsiandrae]MBC9880353.1 hypothetical protein [Bradyrhizobium campsiandrae]MBC9981504.1 hypothetical protein [Bradyrhizobium campsiandrae]